MSTHIRRPRRRMFVPAVVVLGAVAALGGTSLGAQAERSPMAGAATAPGANGPIAFMQFAGKHEDDSSAQIFVRSPAGAVRQLTHVRGGAADPDWAPDGSRIAFGAWLGSQPDQLYTVNADGSDPRPLTTGCTAAAGCLGERWAAYSPDGSQVAFVRDFGPLVTVGARHDRVPSATDLLVVPATGGAPTVVRHFEGDPLPGEPTWSPDGLRLAFPLSTAKHPTKQSQFLDALNVLDLATGALAQITPLALGASDPDWSPDGQLIAFASAAGHSPYVYLVHPDGSGLRSITVKAKIFSRIKAERHVGRIAQFQPTWSPDGTLIAFARESRPCGGRHMNSCTGADREPPFDLWTMRPDGTHVRQLTRGARFQAQPAWGPRG
jgi:Tol biopolymer transport system component